MATDGSVTLAGFACMFSCGRPERLRYDSTVQNERIPCAEGSRWEDSGRRQCPCRHCVHPPCGLRCRPCTVQPLRNASFISRDMPKARIVLRTSVRMSTTGVEATGVEDGCIAPGGGEEVQREKTVTRYESLAAPGVFSARDRFGRMQALNCIPSSTLRCLSYYQGIIRSEIRGWKEKLSGVRGSSRRGMSDKALSGVRFVVGRRS
ncbi:hypothetical protein C8F01DRAFT_1173318 [Mycena amicta]|nr:hypothetical protein C8F01DRAFT_1173318 [Mycena amicta]